MVCTVHTGVPSSEYNHDIMDMNGRDINKAHAANMATSGLKRAAPTQAQADEGNGLGSGCPPPAWRTLSGILCGAWDSVAPNNSVEESEAMYAGLGFPSRSVGLVVSPLIGLALIEEHYRQVSLSSRSGREDWVGESSGFLGFPDHKGWFPNHGLLTFHLNLTDIK